MYTIDRLYDAVAERGHVCVGLDTAVEYVPPRERRRAGSEAEAVFAYNRALIDATLDVAACYKVQIACYEEGGLPGLGVYAQTLAYLRGRGALVIADVKRGDIADTAGRYARAHFEGDFEADFVTLSPYMGMDSIEPWLEWADRCGKGAFVLTKTSNRGARDFECLKTADGGKLYEAVGEKLISLAETRLGVHGYGAFGAVVGAEPKTPAEREEAAALRQKFKKLFFLIPGYGAQGGGAADAALLLQDGNGGVVNASRSILRAWQTAARSATQIAPGANDADNVSAAECARNAAIEMRDALLEASRSAAA